MKFLSLFFALLFVSICVYAQEPDDDKADDIQMAILKFNKISQMNIYYYHIKRNGKKVDSTLILTFDYTNYDDGHMLVKITKNDENHTISNFNVFYNKLGQIIRIIKDQENSIRDIVINPLDIPENYAYEYDASGKEISVIKYNSDTSYIATHTRICDSTGRWIRTMVKVKARNSKNSTNGFILNDSVFYDPNGKLSSRQFYDNLGVKTSTFLYSYESVGDDREMITIFKQIGDEERFVSKEIFNKYGQRTQTSIIPYYDPYPSNYDEANKLAKLFYNDNGTLNSCIGYDNGKVLYITKFFYK